MKKNCRTKISLDCSFKGTVSIKCLARPTWMLKWEFLFSFFQLFLLPQEMYLDHPGGFYYIFIYSILQQLHRFNGFCHENKVLGAFCHTSPPERIETTTLASYPSADQNPGTHTNRVRNSPQQHHHLADGYRYILYTMCSRLELVLEFLPQEWIEP